MIKLASWISFSLIAHYGHIIGDTQTFHPIHNITFSAYISGEEFVKLLTEL